MCLSVFWSCQFIARASNMSLRHWQQMGGVTINEDLIIDKTIHRTINSHSAVLKVVVLFCGKVLFEVPVVKALYHNFLYEFINIFVKIKIDFVSNNL